MLKVLSVREYDKLDEVTYSNSCGGNSGRIQVKKTHYVVVVAVNTKTKIRKRIAFSEAHTSEFLGCTMYEGYAGDYQLLVPGDIFEIQETQTFRKVVITQPAE